MSDVQQAKRELRSCILAARKAIPSHIAEADCERILRRILDLLSSWGGGLRVVAYLSIGSEVRTAPLCRALLARGHELALPRIDSKGGMSAVAIASLEAVSAGPMGVMEPIGDAALSAPPEVIIVPGVAFSSDGERLGRGKGYYDRFLQQWPAALRVAPAFECQLVERIPTEPHDEPVDRIVTPRRLIHAPDRPDR